MPKAISHDKIQGMEGEFISADEWNEDQFNKAEPIPDQVDMAAALRRAGQTHGRAQQEAFNRQQAFGPGFQGAGLNPLFGLGSPFK